MDILLQERGPLPGPENGLLSNTWKWIVLGDTCANKARGFIGKGTWVESRRVREPRRAALPRDLQSWVLWWWDYFQGCLWPIFLTQSPSWWCTPCSAKWISERRILGGGRTCGVTFWPFPNSYWWWRLIIPCSLPGPLVVKQLMQMVTMLPGQGGWFQSVCFP